MKQNKIFFIGLLMILTVGILSGCTKNTTVNPNDNINNEQGQQEQKEFNIKDYITEEIVGGKMVIKAKNDEYTWINYDDGFLNVEVNEEVPYAIYTVAGTEAATTAINLIGDYQDNRISYLVYLTVNEDLTISSEYTVDSAIIELEQEDTNQAVNVDEDLSVIASKTLSGIPEDQIPAFVETRMIDMNNTNELEYMIGKERLAGLEKLAVSESMMTSTAFSIVTLKFDTNDNAKAAAKTLLTSAPKEKWVCVIPEVVKTRVVNDTYVVLFMGFKSSEDAFNNIQY